MTLCEQRPYQPRPGPQPWSPSLRLRSLDRFGAEGATVSDARVADEGVAAAQRALQRALDSMAARGNRQRPHFESTFHEHLCCEFPDASKVSTQQAGGWNRWSLTVDELPAMSCSVRIVVSHQDSGVVLALCSKARIAKECLRREDGAWAKELQPENDAFTSDGLLAFEQECARLDAACADGSNLGFSLEDAYEVTFDDPFVLTASLWLVSGYSVEWTSIASARPEILLAQLPRDLFGFSLSMVPHVALVADPPTPRADSLRFAPPPPPRTGRGGKLFNKIGRGAAP